MPSKPLPIEQILTMLGEGPPRIESLTAALAPAQLQINPNADEWSANDVLAHLRACADVWGNNMLAIIAEEGQTLRGVNPRVWIKKTDYLEQDFQPSLDAFAKQRRQLLAVLESLPPEGWSRSATVMAWGNPFERTVLYYAERLVRHERPHLRQIERIVDRVQPR